jgi:hypothetical protein
MYGRQSQWGGHNLGNGPQPQPAAAPAFNAQAIVQQLEQIKQTYGGKLMELDQKIAQMTEQLRRGVNVEFPEQHILGQIAYPDRYPFDMVLSSELRTADGSRFGATNAVCQTIIKVDVDNPTIMKMVTFNLFKPDIELNNEPIGIFLPLSGTRITQWNGALIYPGRDFNWRIRTSSDDRQWQTGWRGSDILDGDHRNGYVIPTEYELRRNDSLIIEAQPIGPVQEDQQWTLNVSLHIYKMLQRRDQR